ILLDVIMPRLSGYEVCRKIREKYDQASLPVIMLTSKRLVADLVAGFDAGANDFLAMPFDKRELIARVNTMLRLRQAGLDRENLLIMQREMEIAAQVQKTVLTDPASINNTDLCDTEIVYLPQNGMVGGDYYSVKRIGEDAVTVMIADATGHGMQAALSIMQIDILNKQTESYIDPDRRLKEINEYLIQELESKNFFTAFIVNIYKDKITYATAGHPVQYLIRYDSGELIPLKGKGKIIGIKTDLTFELKEESVRSGDILLLFTDGVFEEFSNKGGEFGEERFTELIRKKAANGKHRDSIDEFVRIIIDDIKAFVGEEQYNDDITMLGIRIK
ncbi:MAG: PP2C family protein-serine/threonine phosphatase, partial [Spirochaetota bacterium]